MVEIRQESAHICGYQLFFIVDAGNRDLPMTYHGEVIRVCCNEEHLWREKHKHLIKICTDYLECGRQKH